MRTFAQTPKAMQQTAPSRSAPPGRVHFRQSSEVKPSRVIGSAASQPRAAASHLFQGDLQQLPTPRPAASIQKQTAKSEAVGEDRQDTRTPQHADPAVSRIGRALRSPGQPLDQPVRAAMEQSFGQDFSRVVVHTGEAANRSAREMNAHAYTVGTDIVFGAQKFAPGSQEGKNLLAHELTHVVQQQNAPVNTNAVEPQGSTAEREAQAAASNVMAGRTVKPPSALPRGVPRDVGWASREGDIPDPHGIGYNTLYKNAGPDSRAAVLALTSLELPSLFVDLDAYKKLPAPVRQSILALKPHAAGTGCAGWFDVMRANDPDFKPTYTPQQLREAEAAYHSSTRDAALGKKVEAAKAQLPTLDPMQVDARWNQDKYALVKLAQTPNHGIKAEVLHSIWVKYWADKIAVAEDTLNAVFAAEMRDHTDLSDTDTYRKAKAAYDLGFYLFADTVGALAICRFADAANKSLTLDELTAQVISHSKFMEGMQLLALALSGAGGGAGGRSAKPGLSSTEPVSSGPGRTDPVTIEPLKAEPVKTEPLKTEPLKTEPVKTAPAKPELKTPPTTSPPVKPEPVKTEQKPAGQRVVAGRVVKPRLATATKYVWANPRMAKGNFIEAELSADGALDITVKSGGPDELRVGGSEMFDDVFEHFGADKIHEFDAKWVRNSSYTANYTEYVQNLGKGMKPQEAAWNTWTGRQLKARGFTSVEVPAHGESPEVVSPVFKK